MKTVVLLLYLLKGHSLTKLTNCTKQEHSKSVNFAKAVASWPCGDWKYIVQEAQLSQRDRMTLRVIECFAKSLKVIRNVCMSYRFWDIQRQTMAWPWNLGYGSFKVTENGAVRCIIYDFLLVGHCKYSCMLYHFQVIWRSIIITLKRSLEVIQTGTIRKLGCSFLLAFHN